MGSDRSHAAPGAPVAFAGADEESPPELAIAVVLQNQSGTGGTTAAPIARAVMQAILQGTENP